MVNDNQDKKIDGVNIAAELAGDGLSTAEKTKLFSLTTKLAILINYIYDRIENIENNTALLAKLGDVSKELEKLLQDMGLDLRQVDSKLLIKLNEIKVDNNMWASESEKLINAQKSASSQFIGTIVLLGALAATSIFNTVNNFNERKELLELEKSTKATVEEIRDLESEYHDLWRYDNDKKLWYQVSSAGDTLYTLKSKDKNESSK